MEIKVELISKEMIKPSSPTPLHLQNLKLSFLDQIAPPLHVPIIFFYPHHQLINHNTNILSLQLKHSLSQTLTTFYPLAGTIQENSSIIHCNDAGAEFIVVRVRAPLSQVIKEPVNMVELKKLQPVDDPFDHEKVVLAVKLSFFDCGGIAVAVSFSHKASDGTSGMAFFNAWAATCRGETTNISSRPSFDLASFFPPPNNPSRLQLLAQYIGLTREKIVTKRFVFDKEKILELKKSCGGDPTRVEAVSACIWRSLMEAKKMTFAATHIVNLRPRRRPQFPENSFGNCWRPAIAWAGEGEDSGNYSDLTTRLRASIRKIDDEFVKTRVENVEGLMCDLSGSMDMYLKGGVEFVSFTSWCRFPLYEVDFGWGKACLVCTTSVPVKNMVILMSGWDGEEIEAWVNMVEDDMNMFEDRLRTILKRSPLFVSRI